MVVERKGLCLAPEDTIQDIRVPYDVEGGHLWVIDALVSNLACNSKMDDSSQIFEC